jgi:Flp pilus assembly protein TadG
VKKKIDNERGASAVEFAIVLPVLVIMVFGIIEFGIVFYNKAMITNACREAARAAIVYRTPLLDATEMQTEIDSVVAAYLTNPNDPTKTILIPENTPIPVASLPNNKTCATAGQELNVTLSYDHSFIALPNWFDTIKITTVTKMRCE